MDYAKKVPRAKHLLGVNASLTSSLSGFGLDEKVDQEKAWKKSSKCDGQVSSELNLQGDSVGGHGLNNAVHGESRGAQGSNRKGAGGNLGGCGGGRLKTKGEISV